MQAHLQGIEIQAVGTCDDDFAVEDASVRQPLQKHVVELRKVPIEWPEVAALDEDVGCSAKHQCAKSVPLRLEEEPFIFGQRIGERGQHRCDWWREHLISI